MFEKRHESSSRLGAGCAQSLQRIMREYEEIKESKNPYWTAAPIDLNDPFEWHFTVRGPPETEFDGGIYHGRLLLPNNYPLSAPSISLLHQSGRFEVGKKVCMSASPYHPELWQPAWGIRTMFDALHVFFATPADGALNSLNWPVEVRKKIAQESIFWKCPVCDKNNKDLIELYCSPPNSSGPTLPVVMIPCNVSKACNYLKAVASVATSSAIKAKDTIFKCSESVSSIIEETDKTIVDEINNNEILSNNSDVEKRRELRRKAAAVDIYQNCIWIVLLRVLIIKPLKEYADSFLFSSSQEKIKKSLDIILFILIFITILIVIDICKNPGELYMSFILYKLV